MIERWLIVKIDAELGSPQIELLLDRSDALVAEVPQQLQMITRERANGLQVTTSDDRNSVKRVLCFPVPFQVRQQNEPLVIARVLEYYPIGLLLVVQDIVHPLK